MRTTELLIGASLLVGLALAHSAAPGDALRTAYSRPVADWPAVEVDVSGFVEFAPLPKAFVSPRTRRRSALGARVFADPVLSVKGDVSCATCHDPAAGFTVPTPTATGHEGIRGRRNPTALLDTPHRSAFGWDGGFEDLHERLLAPLTDPSEMGNSDFGPVLRRLGESPAYRADFHELFGASSIETRHLAEALAAYLVAQDRETRFDRFLAGDGDLLTDQEIAGLHLFRTRAGCVNCHFGPRLTDDRFHNLGLSSFGEPGEDLGRSRITGRDEDIGRFQTPSLRHVGATAPYMHHGLFPDLEGVVNFYARGGGEIWVRNAREAADPRHRHAATVSPLLRRRDLSAAEKAALVAFLKAL